MQPTTGLACLAAAFAVGAQSAPVASTQSANPLSGEATGLVKRLDKCGGSSFYDETSGGSPLIADCQRLANNLSGGGRWWTYVYNGNRELARYGTCKFNILTVADYGTAVGDLDVKDLIRDSIAKFGRNGRVGARGVMNCSPDDSAVWWWIWHT